VWESISVDAIKNIDKRETKMKEEISRYAQELRENTEKKNSITHRLTHHHYMNF
jgi:uncharacterized protein YoaH (UPF0181 family)